MYNSVEQLIKAGERIRTSEAFAADYKSAPFVHFGTPAIKVWVVQSTTQLAGTLIRGIAPHRLSL